MDGYCGTGSDRITKGRERLLHFLVNDEPYRPVGYRGLDLSRTGSCKDRRKILDDAVNAEKRLLRSGVARPAEDSRDRSVPPTLSVFIILFSFCRTGSTFFMS